MLENYEGTAIDTAEFTSTDAPEVQPTEVPQTEDVVETVAPEVQETTTQQPIEVTEIEVPGIGKLSIDEIKEMRQGALRQSDYTKKTQELALQRQQLKDAEELFNYLKANPQLVEAMKAAEQNPNPTVLNRATPEAEMIQQIAYNQKAIEVDMKLNQLKGKYGDVDEIELFKKATELRTDDLEFVYKALQYDKSTIDKDAIIAEAKAQLKAELEANKGAVTTIVGNKPATQIQTPSPLTAEQKRIADAMGLSEDEYRKWM
jgi:hypothetical protein